MQAANEDASSQPFGVVMSEMMDARGFDTGSLLRRLESDYGDDRITNQVFDKPYRLAATPLNEGENGRKNIDRWRTGGSPTIKIFAVALLIAGVICESSDDVYRFLASAGHGNATLGPKKKSQISQLLEYQNIPGSVTAPPEGVDFSGTITAEASAIAIGDGSSATVHNTVEKPNRDNDS